MIVDKKTSTRQLILFNDVILCARREHSRTRNNDREDSLRLKWIVCLCDYNANYQLPLDALFVISLKYSDHTNLVSVSGTMTMIDASKDWANRISRAVSEWCSASPSILGNLVKLSLVTTREEV